jgi:hypothetical protein
VKRGESRELLDRPLDLRIDQHRPVEPAAAVDDAVADGLRCDEAVDGTGFVAVNEVKLEARGAGVDDQHIHRRGFS